MANLGEATEQESNDVKDIGHKEVIQSLSTAVRGKRQQDPLHHGLQNGAHRHVALLNHPIDCTEKL